MGYWLLWIGALLVAGASAVVGLKVPKDPTHLWIHWIVIVGWIMGPPTWFLVDAAMRIQPGGRGELNGMEEFFYHASVKFWAAVVLLLAAIYKGPDWLE